MKETEVFDLIGIGIGPFNLSLAALCDDISGLSCIFIDRKPTFDWHPGMMIPGARMQVPFYADLVTPVNPRSHYSFLNYLCETNKMYRFGINEQLFITRKEYNNYCQWVCSLLKNLHFNETCTLIESSGENYKIITNKTFYYAKHVVIGVGNVPYMPEFINPKEHENVIHSSDYLFQRERLLSLPSVTIIGSGQSAAEIFYDLLHQRDRFKEGLNWFTRAERFYPMEYSKLTLEMSTPDYINFFFSLNEEKRDKLFPKHDVLYKGINSNLINEIYNLLYEQWIEENASPVQMEANCELTARITLNPEFIAKSYFPSELLRTVGLETVGSRAKSITPEKRSKGREPEQTFTTELFVVGKRPSFKGWANNISNFTEATPGASQITAIEEVSFPTPEDKIKYVEPDKENTLYEVVLYLDEEHGEKRYLNQFKAYLQRHNLNPSFAKRFYAGGLCFVELEGRTKDAEYIAQFSLVRAIRTMPSLRLLRPAIRTGGVDKSLKIDLPNVQPLDPSMKVAIFDGGVPDNHPITRWVNVYDAPGVGAAIPELLEHGVGVTSAFLFGHIDPKSQLSQPYSYVDHYRVLDDVPGQNPYELYEILDRIKDILKTREYHFINLSLGPNLPIEDDDIHAWTAVLDEHLSDGSTLATIAVGNDGEGDPAIKANRVQVPSDCVNALAVGACDVPDENWQRASYSSVGPGRSPGIIKPDLVEFGGSVPRPFLTLDAEDGTQIIPTGGTSFSSPATLRMAAGVRAHFGQSSLNTLAIKTLLIHCCEPSIIPKTEVGWGRLARTLDDIVVCNEAVMRVVFQGKISASKYIRTPIPVPAGPIAGMVTIKATLCYATAVDPHHPENYTRSGLSVTFRPNKDKKTEDEERGTSIHAVTKTFFGTQQKEYQTEEELRRDAWKWENCLHAQKRMRGSSLNDPVFDIHYNARAEGHNDTRNQEIQYALVITVEAPKVKDLYDQVVRRYATQLEQLTPVIDIPIRV